MLTQIRSFLTVAEVGSVRRAAVRLRMSQPALSRQIQVLEHELGGRLLERTSTGVELTRAGHALATGMGAVLTSYDRAMLEVRRLTRGESDQLRIGYMASAAREYLDGARRRVRQQHPDTAIKLLDLSPGEQVAALRSGQIDVGLTDDSGALLVREFYVRRLARMTGYAALSELHPLAGEKQVRLAELKDDVFVSGADAHIPGADRRLIGFCRKFGRFRPKFTAPVQSLAETFENIANENTVALLPAFMRHHVVPGISLVPLADRGVTWEILVIWQRGKVGGALKTLLDALFE